MNWTWQVRCQNKRFGLSKLVFAKPWNKPSYIDKKPILARQLNDWTMKTYWNYDVLCSHIANLFIHGGEEHICWTKREYKQKNRSKERLFQEYGWGNRTRTYEWRDQNPLPYQLGYTPILVRKERLELSRREALEPKSSVSTNSTTSARKWGGRWDLNPRQPESQSGALPTELRPPLRCCIIQIIVVVW